MSNNFEFERQKLPQVLGILKRHAMSIVRFDIADSEQDTKQATDLTVTLKGGAVGVRVRRFASTSRQYRDWTIRFRSQYGNATEIHKLRDGWGDFYLYAWEDDHGELREYMLFDLHQVRAEGLLDPSCIYMKSVRSNRGMNDNTAFVTIPARELQERGCMVVHTIDGLQGKAQVASRSYLLKQIENAQSNLGQMRLHLTGA